MNNKIIDELKEGNLRFVTKFGLGFTPLLTQNKKPQVAIFSCSDNLIPVEKIFNSQDGDLILINQLSLQPYNSVIASLEFAVKYYQIKQIIVLGHTYCDCLKLTLDHNINVSDIIDKYVISCRNDIISKSDIIKEAVINKKLKVNSAVFDNKEGLVYFI